MLSLSIAYPLVHGRVQAAPCVSAFFSKIRVSPQSFVADWLASGARGSRFAALVSSTGLTLLSPALSGAELLELVVFESAVSSALSVSQV